MTEPSTTTKADSEPSGCVGCVFALGLLSGLVYAVLSWCGVTVPKWVLWADAAAFAVLIVLALLVQGLPPGGQEAGTEPKGK